MLVTAFVICLVICLHGMYELMSNVSADTNATQSFLHTVGVNEAVHSDVRETAANVDLFRVFTNDRVACLLTHTGGTGVSRLTRGLTTLPQGGSRSLQWSETGMEDPQEDPLAVHCFCVCSGSALLVDLLGVSRYKEHDLLSVQSIYPMIFLRIFIVYRRIVRILYLLLYSAIC